MENIFTILINIIVHFHLKDGTQIKLFQPSSHFQLIPPFQFYAAEISSELENYGSTNQMKYRLSDFQMMTDLFFDNFAFSLS